MKEPRMVRINADASRLILFVVFFGASAGCGGEPRPRAQPTTSATSESEPRIYVADWANQRVVRMNDMQGNGWITYSGSEEKNQLRYPVGMCLDSASRIYISEQYHHRIIRMDDMLGTNF